MARIFFIFLQIQLGSSFILLNGSSVARLSSFEFQQLSQLLINEEHSRNHLENNLTSLEQRVSEIESDLKTKYAQDIANVKDALEGQMNHTKSLMEKEINTTKAALNHQAQALEKEKSDRRQLEREYTKLIMDFNNLSRAHSDLRKENVNLNESIRNYSTDTSTKLRSLMVDIQAVNVSSEMQKGNLSALDGVVGHLEQNAGYQSAFTTTATPAALNGSASGEIVFPGVLTNVGGHYNGRTGKYTCPYNGIYYFYLHIYKTSTHEYAWCWIRKNGSRLVVAYAQPGVTNAGGNQGGTASATLYLRTNDVVSLGTCTEAKSIRYHSTFGGFLLQTDL